MSVPSSELAPQPSLSQASVFLPPPRNQRRGQYSLASEGAGGTLIRTTGEKSGTLSTAYLKVVTNEKGEAVGEVLTIIC